MVTQNIIQQLEALYQKLMTKDLTPDEEAQAKVQLLEILSSVKAHAEIQQGAQAKNVMAQTNSLKDLLLDWDPYGSAWFKEEKTLVNSVYNILAAVKSMLIQKPAAPDSTAINNLKQQVEGLATSFKSQFATLQNEVATIKKSVIALANALKELMAKKPAPQQSKSSTPAAQQTAVSLTEPAIRVETRPSPKPVPIPEAKIKKVTPKPISLPKPIPLPTGVQSSEQEPKPFMHERAKPIPIPKPRPEQVQELSPGPRPILLAEPPDPSPILITGADLEEPIPLDGAPTGSGENQQLFGALSASREETKKPNKEHLFSLFSSGATESSLSDELELEVELSGSEDLSPQIFPQETYAASRPSADPETLYQELISLEGKRYSIERSIRDLKTDRENGILSDQEYKEKLSQLVNKLQTISKRIETIRETLD